MGNILLAAQILAQLLQTGQQIAAAISSGEISDEQLASFKAQTDAAFAKVFGPK